MKLKPLMLVGFVLAALIGLADASGCPHAEAANIVAMTGYHADGSASGGEPECHHNRRAVEHRSIAWLRPADRLSAPLLPARGEILFVAQMRDPALAASVPHEPPPLHAIRDGTAGFGPVYLRIQRFLI
ncbi:hypothetical protein [Parvibaculum sp.]|uniref:hypothetical protein n=1 Tax=Parvibaculum sp. TaxID=2024848 RepID=UPI002C9C76F2|nr:hypothetical protein [Parvibaculum sp.]HUD51948.1 hypothetical protein [Parvibaculum sp.]